MSRQPLLPKVLSVSDSVDFIRRPFKSPCPGVIGKKTAELLRHLNARKRFVPWCSSSREPFSPLTNIIPIPLPSSCAAVDDDTLEELPPGIEPLVLWHPEDDDDKVDDKHTPIVVDPRLVRFLRPHQR